MDCFRVGFALGSPRSLLFAGRRVFTPAPAVFPSRSHRRGFASRPPKRPLFVPAPRAVAEALARVVCRVSGVSSVVGACWLVPLSRAPPAAASPHRVSALGSAACSSSPLAVSSLWVQGQANRFGRLQGLAPPTNPLLTPPWPAVVGSILPWASSSPTDFADSTRGMRGSAWRAVCRDAGGTATRERLGGELERQRTSRKSSRFSEKPSGRRSDVMQAPCQLSDH